MLRLRDRRRRLGRLRARQPPVGGPLGAGAAAGGRRQGPLAEHQDPGRVPEAVPHQARLGLRDRARAARGRPLAVHPARQDARRVELDERDAVRARAPAGLRRLGGAGRAGLGLPRRAAVLHQVRGQRPRRLGVPRRRRAAAGHRAALAAPARTGACSPRARRRGSRASPTTTAPSRTACRCSRSPRGTGGASAPPTPSCARRSTRPNLEVRTNVDRAGRRARGRPRGRRAPAQGPPRRARSCAPSARCCSRPARSARRSCCCSRASAPAEELRAAGVQRAPRAARRRAQPPGPPVRDDDLGGLRSATRSTAPTSRSRWPSGCCANRARSARRSPRWSRSRARAAGCRRRTSSSTWAPPTSKTTAPRHTTGTAS